MCLTETARKPTFASYAAAMRLLPLVALALVAGCGASSPGSTATPADNGSTSSAPAEAIASATSAVPTDDPSALPVLAWINNGGRDRSKAIGADAGAIAAGAQSADAQSAVQAGCSRLQTDIESAQQYAPIPDEQAQGPWGQALGKYARAAADCLAGIQSQNASLLNQSGQELNEGNVFIAQVTARLRALSG